MSGSPPVISMSDEEDTWIAEHEAAIKRVKRVKEECQRQWEEEAWRVKEKHQRQWEEEVWREAHVLEPGQRLWCLKLKHYNLDRP